MRLSWAAWWLLLSYAQETLASPAVVTTVEIISQTICSCASTSKSGAMTVTLVYSSSAACASHSISASCKTTTSLTTVTKSLSTTSTSIKTSSSVSSTTTSNHASSSSTTTKVSSSTATQSSKTFSSTKTSMSATPTPTKNSGPRGLSYNNATLTQPFSLSGQNSKVSWSYNWYSYPYTNGQANSGYNPVISFVPMLWSTASDLTSVWSTNVANSRSKYGTNAVLAFNEPDVCWGGTSCMTVSAAVSGWQQYMQPLKGTVRLGAPAVTNSDQSGQGLQWLQSFLQACSNCSFDFIPIHWYGDAGDVAGFEQHVQQAYQIAGGRRLWVTEFGTTSGTAAQTQAFLQTVMQWLDDSTKGGSMVERYAWFMDAAGNLINSNGNGLSSLGSLYNSS